MTTVQKKTVIVTGGANGIGFQCCRECLRNGAKIVAILDLPNSNGEVSVKKLNEEFGARRALFFPSDVTEFEDYEVVFKSAVEALGGLDILINNAGIFDDAHWQREIEVNFTAVVKSTLLGYDYMGKHKGGKGGIIVNVSSIMGLIEGVMAPVYSATKHAVLGFTVSLKDAFERTGVSVRAMCPGVTDAPFADGSFGFLDIFDYDENMKFLKGFYRQPCEHVGKAMIELVEYGTNGAVWISQNDDPPFEVELAKYESITFPKTPKSVQT